MNWSAFVAPTEDRVLDSGLRVLLVHRPGLDFAVVVTQMQGGSRDDPIGAAGTAHLTEHLLSQGLGDDGQPWSMPLLAAGADLGATTHPDYTEFRAEVPYSALPLALRAERARLTAWPELRSGIFERQRAGVCREIEDHCSKRPTRNLPWPALGPLIFGTWADNHDAFGDTEHVRGLSEVDCRQFFDLHHRPDRTVLVVLADLTRIEGGADSVFTAVEVPSRTSPQLQPVTDLPLARSTGIHTLSDWTAPHSIGSMGWRVPSVTEDPHTYAALLAVSAQFGRYTGGRARLGQMSPMDRERGDVLTVTVHDARDALPALERASSEPLDKLQTSPGEVEEAIRRARTSVAATLDQPRAAAQLVGRAVTLGKDPSAAASWVEAVRAVAPHDVTAAARHLSGMQGVGMIGRPTSLALPARRARRTESTHRPDPPGEGPTHVGSVRMVCIDQDSLTTALVARLCPTTHVEDVRHLRAQGYQLTRDGAGWLMERHAYGAADQLADQARQDLNFPDRDLGGRVQHLALCGPHAQRTLPWAVPGRANTNEDPHDQQGHNTPLTVRPCEDLPHGIATAELRWPVDADGFVERWAGIALLMGIHTRDVDGQVNPLDAPTDMFVGIRQELTTRGPELVGEVYAPPERLPAALRHIAGELTRPRIEQRGEHATKVIETLAAGWQRDASAPLSLVKRAMVVLDLGGADDDIHKFVPRLYATSAGAIIERISRDTENAPRGVITTSAPDALYRARLPWDLSGSKQVDSCH